MVVEGDVRGCDARAEPLHRRHLDRLRPVVVRTQPGARVGAAVHAGVGEERQRFQRPLVALLVGAGPRVSEHVVTRFVQAREQRVVCELRQQAGREVGGEHGNAGLVRVKPVAEEFGEPLPVDTAAVAAALVELVHHAPGPAPVERGLVAVGDAEVRPAQPVAGEVLPGARDDDDACALARRQFVELQRDARRQREILLHRRDGRPPRLAVLPGRGRSRRAGEQRQRAGNRRGAAQESIRPQSRVRCRDCRESARAHRLSRRVLPCSLSANARISPRSLRLRALRVGSGRNRVSSAHQRTRSL